MNTLALAPAPHTPTINAVDLRHQLGEVLERVHDRFEQFRVMRKDKPMARIVNESYMQALEELMQADPALAETLEILMNAEAMNAIEQGTQEIAEGKLLPLETILED